MNTIWSQFLVLEYEDPKPASSLPPTPRNASFWVFFHGEALMTSIRLAHTVLQHFFMSIDIKKQMIKIIF